MAARTRVLKMPLPPVTKVTNRRKPLPLWVKMPSLPATNVANRCKSLPLRVKRPALPAIEPTLNLARPPFGGFFVAAGREALSHSEVASRRRTTAPPPGLR